MTWHGCLSRVPCWLPAMVTYLSRCPDTVCSGGTSRPRVCHAEASSQAAPTPPAPTRTSPLHPHLCTHSPRQQWPLRFFFQFSGPEPLAEPGSSWPLWRQNLNRLWAEERAWTAGPRERILSGTLTRSLSQSWEAREALADSGFLLLQDTEVSVSKLLVIPFFN